MSYSIDKYEKLNPIKMKKNSLDGAEVDGVEVAAIKKNIKYISQKRYVEKFSFFFHNNLRHVKPKDKIR